MDSETDLEKYMKVTDSETDLTQLGVTAIVSVVPSPPLPNPMRYPYGTSIADYMSLYCRIVAPKQRVRLLCSLPLPLSLFPSLLAPPRACSFPFSRPLPL